MYPEFAKIANEEGFNEIATMFTSIGKAEKFHEDRYNALVANIKEARVFKRGEAVEWNCRNCGYTHSSLDAPNMCPACLHPQAHFQLNVANY